MPAVAQASLQQLRPQFALEERVGVADIDQQSSSRAPSSISATRVMLAPRRADRRRDNGRAPSAPHGTWPARRSARRPRRCGTGPGAERERQRAMPAHRMAGDPLPRPCRPGNSAATSAGSSSVDIGPHAEMRRPRLLGRVDVEARALAEVPRAFGIVGHLRRRAGWCRARRRSCRARRRRRDTRLSR